MLMLSKIWSWVAVVSAYSSTEIENTIRSRLCLPAGEKGVSECFRWLRS